MYNTTTNTSTLEKFAQAAREAVQIDTARTRSEVIAVIIEWFNDNENVFNTCMEELDWYNGYLGDDRYYDMDELDELYNGQPASEILARAFYGYDAETWSTDNSGRRSYGPFNPNRYLFTYNGAGNLVSADYKDYSAHLDHYAVEAMQENRRYIDEIDNNDELRDLFDELNEAEG